MPGLVGRRRPGQIDLGVAAHGRREVGGYVGPVGGGGGGGVVGHSDVDGVVVGPASSVPVELRTATLTFQSSAGTQVGIVFDSVAPLVAAVNGFPVPVVP